MRFFLSLVLAFVALMAAPAAMFAENISLTEITRDGEGKLSIAVNSSDATVANLARRAFGLHGAFTVTTGRSAFVVAIEPAGGSSVLLTIGSGQPYTEQLRRDISGRDLQHAVLRACDLVVEATVKEKGFFAGKLAFVGKQRGVSEIYTSDLLFNRVTPLTRDRALVTGPKWSPDGSKIVCTTYFRTGFPDIYVIDVQSRRKTPIATYKGTNTGAVFSPNGRQLAMSLSGTGNSEIYVSDARGKNTRRLTTNKSLEASPSWSPDGRRLVYTSDAPGQPQLYEISSQGGPSRRLPTNISRYCSEPVWNPVFENLIAFTASVGGGFQIALYDSKTRSSRWLTQGASSLEPTWLRDGRHLVFTQRNGGRTRLMILDSETGKTAPLHKPGFGDASSPSFVY